MPLCLPWNTRHPRQVTVMTGKRDKQDEKRARNFLESFNALSLTSRRKSDTNTTGKADDAVETRAARHAQDHSFRVPGGFAPPPPPPHLPSPSPQWPPRPNNAAGVSPPPPVLYPRMPVPQHTSLTMQHAIAGSLPPPGAVLATPPRAPAYRPQVAGPSHSPAELGVRTPVPRPASDDLPPLPLPPPPPSHGQSRTPQPPKLRPPQVYRRAQSEPLSPPPAPPSDIGKETRQCCGITAAGKRCRKQVKVSGAQAHTDGDVFCHVHGNKVGEPSGFYDRKTGQTFIKFNGELHVFSSLVHE